jgi:hypothetical protein
LHVRTVARGFGRTNRPPLPLRAKHATTNRDGEAALPSLPSLGGLWSVAKAVQSAVQATADDVVRSVAQTDWRSELTAFTHEVEAEAHRAVEVVQHLPDKLQQQQASAAEVCACWECCTGLGGGVAWLCR